MGCIKCLENHLGTMAGNQTSLDDYKRALEFVGSDDRTGYGILRRDMRLEDLMAIATMSSLRSVLSDHSPRASSAPYSWDWEGSISSFVIPFAHSLVRSKDKSSQSEQNRKLYGHHTPVVTRMMLSHISIGRDDR